MLLVGNRGQGHSTSVMRTPKKKRKIWRFRGISETQIQSHMTLWVMMAAPLLASHDLSDSTDFDRAMLMNPEILAINQDPLGIQGRQARDRRRVVGPRQAARRRLGGRVDLEHDPDRPLGSGAAG